MNHTLHLILTALFAVLISGGWACTKATNTQPEEPALEETAPEMEEGTEEGDDGAGMEETEETEETGGAS